MTKEKFRAIFDTMPKFLYTFPPLSQILAISIDLTTSAPAYPCSARSQRHFEWSISENARQNLGGRAMGKISKNSKGYPLKFSAPTSSSPHFSQLRDKR